MKVIQLLEAAQKAKKASDFKEGDKITINDTADGHDGEHGIVAGFRDDLIIVKYKGESSTTWHKPTKLLKGWV